MSTIGSWSTGIKDIMNYTRPEVDPAEKKQADLDKNAFLNLLITQMQYQDPMNPVEDKEFLAQMAQFSSLEQLQNLYKVQSEAQSYNLIGKYVVSHSYDENTGDMNTVEGRVEGVTSKGDDTYVIIGENEVKLSSIANVFEDYTELQQMSMIETALSISQNIALIGKTVEYNEFNEDGEVVEVKTGVVDHVKFVEGGVVLSINGEEVFASAISRITNGEFTENVTPETLPELVPQDTDPETLPEYIYNNSGDDGNIE